MTPETLIDGPSAAIVLGGTVLATVLRCGWRECRITAAEIGALWLERFDAAAARAELAVQVQEIQRDGILRAQPHLTGDSEFDEATGALIRQRSLPALIAAHEKHKARRTRMGGIAVRLFAQASELAPAFGMVGTLFALNRLPSGLAGGDFSGAISMAVLTTLYGLLAANLIFAPFSRLIERRVQAEEAQRQAIVDWLAAQLAEACPTCTPIEQPRPRQEAA